MSKIPNQIYAEAIKYKLYLRIAYSFLICSLIWGLLRLNEFNKPTPNINPNSINTQERQKNSIESLKNLKEIKNYKNLYTAYVINADANSFNVDMDKGILSTVHYGKAFSIDKSGLFMTALHCVDDNQEIYIIPYQFNNKIKIEECKANVIWKSEAYDIAILQTNGVSLKPVNFTSEVKVEGRVVSLGTELASGKIIRVNFFGNGFYRVYHDSPLRKGDSGSPLINLSGQLVGINTKVKFTYNQNLKASHTSSEAVFLQKQKLVNLIESLKSN